MNENQNENDELPGTYTDDFGIVAVITLSADAVVNTEGVTP